MSQLILSFLLPVLFGFLLGLVKLFFSIKALFRLISIHRSIIIQNSNRIDRIERFLQSNYRYDPGTIEPIIDELSL